MIIKHKKGKHRSTPYLLNIGRYNRLEFCVTLDIDAMYDHAGNDQLDWNKLTGISFNLLTSHKNSAMVGWRYDIDSNLFELNAYFHVSGTRTYTPTIAQVAPGDTVCGAIQVEADGTVSVRIKDITHYQPFPKLKRWRRQISSWFGGNRPAPRNLNFQLNTKAK